MTITDEVKIPKAYAEKLKDAYKNLMSANFNNANIPQMTPVVVAASLLGEVIKYIDDNTVHVKDNEDATLRSLNKN